jgi:hypothetical protein
MLGPSMLVFISVVRKSSKICSFLDSAWTAGAMGEHPAMMATGRRKYGKMERRDHGYVINGYEFVG